MLRTASSLLLAAPLLLGCARGHMMAGTTAPGHRYAAALNGGNEVPATPSTAAATATFDLAGRTLTYRVTVVSPLSGPATAAHIHVGPPGESGGVVVPLTVSAVASGAVSSGSVTLGANGAIPGDSLVRLIEAGNAYVNVHTAQYPAGEIRGQIARQ